VSAPSTPQLPTVHQDLPCATCAYNLRTIAESGRCPECGVAVAQTRHDYANCLAASDPYFQRAIRSGLDCVALAILCPVASALFLRYPDYDLGNWLTGTRQQLAISLAPAIFAILGCWRLATREPNRPAHGLPPDARGSNYALRITAVCWLIPMVLEYGPYNRTFYWNNDYQPLRACLYLCILPATFLFFRRLRHLADRLPSRAIRKQAAILTWLALASTMMGIVIIKSLHDPGLVYGLRERPIVAAAAPWSLYEVLDDFSFPMRLRYWAFIGLPAAISLWILALIIQFRLALLRSKRPPASFHIPALPIL
jgi:hypothetical protein